MNHTEHESVVNSSPTTTTTNTPLASIDASIILGQDSFELLSEMMKSMCKADDSTPTPTPTPPTSSSANQIFNVEQSFLSSHLCSMDKWTAKQWFDKYLICKLIDLLEQIPYCCYNNSSERCLRMKAFLDLDYDNGCFDDVIK
ncbi:unnamed protein product, partial [Schistosoma turkestanicum]